MKPAGRALEIVAVGLGQAGGNLAAEFNRRGYRALALNTASTDLSSLSQSGLSLPEGHRMYIGVDGHDGAGSDVSYGRDCVTAHAASIRERVGEYAEGADVLLLTCGLGGGTGSAVAELVEVLSELSLPLMVLAALPNDHESGITKVNAVRAVNELVKENLLGWIFVDNSRLAQAHGDVSFDRYYAEINKVIAEPLDSLNMLNERDGIAAIRALDGEDLRTLLLSGGLLNFGSKEIGKLTVDSIIEAVRDSVQFSPVMPEGFQLENVAYMGVVIEAPPSLLKDMPYSFFEQISEQLKDETGGAAIYMGVYRVEGATTGTVRILCSSQSLPEGIQEMVTSAKREGAQLREKLQQTLSGLDLGEIEEYELFRTSPGAIRRPRISEQPPRPAKPNKRSKAEAKAEAKAPAPPPPPAPIIRDSVRPGASLPPPGGASIADRETYDEMVREFRSSDDAEVRERVTKRLEADRQSENSLVRYYAVRAMTKLDPSLFETALEAATHDEDATVRAIATKALQQRA